VSEELGTCADGTLSVAVYWWWRPKSRVEVAGEAKTGSKFQAVGGGGGTRDGGDG
jgi:hypothetical protein